MSFPLITRASSEGLGVQELSSGPAVLSRDQLDVAQYGSGPVLHTSGLAEDYRSSKYLEELKNFFMAVLPPVVAVLALNLFLTVIAVEIDGGQSAMNNPELDLSMRVSLSAMVAIMAIGVRSLLLESLEGQR